MGYKRSTFPEQVDTILEVFDIPPSEKTNALRYQELKLKTNLTVGEQTELNNLTTQLQNYLITPELFNKFADICINLEIFFNENTIQHINALKADMIAFTNNKKIEFDNEIAKFTPRGTYNQVTQYFKLNVVDYNDGSGIQAYLCIKDSLGFLPTNTTYFKKLTIRGQKGDKGQDGLNLVFKGAYNPTTAYMKDQAIQYGGVVFASLQDNNFGNYPNLSVDTVYWSKLWDTTVTVSVLRGYRNITTDTNTVNFMTGQITVFNPLIDSLEVYKNTSALSEGIHYVISPDNQTITNLQGSWDGTVEPILFDFRVTRNQAGNNLIFSDGQSISENTVTPNKLSTDIQDKLDLVVENSNKIGNLSTLTTTEKGNLVGAINEINNKAGKIGTKDVDETNIQDNYTVRYDGVNNKVVWVQSTIDRNPPSVVTNITAKEDNGSIAILYTTPSDKDYMGTRLVYKTGSYPSDINDGTVIGNYISNTSIAGLINDTQYYFRLFPYDTSNNYNTDISQQIVATPTLVKIYGVRIDKNNSNPSTRCVYTDDASAFTSPNDFDSVYPFNEIKPCLLKNGVVQYYLNPNDYTKKLDGTLSDITSGNDGDVMIEFPKLWWKITNDSNYVYVKYATKQVDSTWKCLAHMRGTTEKNKCYVSAYLGYTTGGKLRSLSGKTPTGNQTIGTFRSQARANGSGYNQMAYFQLLMLQILFVVKYKSTDSQTVLGNGYTNSTNASSIATGGTNAKGMDFGETTGKQQMKFCGIEDFYGNCHYWIDGMYCDSSRNILIGNQSFNNTGSGYTNYGRGATFNLSGYIGDVQGNTETGFIIKNTSGSATTYYCDYGSLYADCLPVFGGYWNDTSNAGGFQLHCSYSASYANSIVSARLLFV